MRRVEHVMGFPVSLRIDDADARRPEKTADAVLRLAARGRRALQPVQEDSEVSRFDQASYPRTSSARTSPRSSTCARSTGWRPAAPFDVRLPGRGLDPCAMVKGWSVQRAAELLTRRPDLPVCLNAGGDVVPPGGPWRVGVRHPERADRL